MRSTSTATSIKVYQQQQQYNLWQFDASLIAPKMGVNNLNGNAQQGQGGRQGGQGQQPGGARGGQQGGAPGGQPGRGGVGTGPGRGGATPPTTGPGRVGRGGVPE